jgi:hypothetical protein
MIILSLILIGICSVIFYFYYQHKLYQKTLASINKRYPLLFDINEWTPEFRLLSSFDMRHSSGIECTYQCFSQNCLLASVFDSLSELEQKVIKKELSKFGYKFLVEQGKLVQQRRLATLEQSFKS